MRHRSEAELVGEREVSTVFDSSLGDWRGSVSADSGNADTALGVVPDVQCMVGRRIPSRMKGLPFRHENHQPSALTGGAFGLRSHDIEETMSAYFTLSRTTFRDSPAWCLEQCSGPDLLPFAVHHRRVRQAVTYAQQVAGLMRCVIVLDGRHRVVCAARGVSEAPVSVRGARS